MTSRSGWGRVAHQDPKNRLAHGRVAQSILVALIVTVAGDHFLDQWRRLHRPETAAAVPPLAFTDELADGHYSEPPIPNGKPPPQT